MSVPEFWSGTLLALVFGVKLGWLPTSGYVSPTDDLGGFFRYLILPAVTVGAAVAGLTMRTLRSSLTETLRQEYIVLARSQGASRRRALWRHAMRNAVIPTITLVGLQIGYLLGGDIIVERLFSYPGLGLLLVESISSLDYPIIQGCILLFAVLFIVVNACVDLLVIYLEPRERRPARLEGIGG
jgi:peptide/nickel transport system permease protein